MKFGTEQKPMSATAAVVRNPLSVVAMFVLLVEGIATITLIQVSAQNNIATPLVWFVVLFPTLIAVLFFLTIWFKHQYLYSPMEYRSDESFLTALSPIARLERIEIRQEAAEINPRTADEDQSMRVVDRLLKLGDVRSAVKVGRTFLEVSQYEAAARIFRHILKNCPETHEDRYNASANLGYALIGLEKFDEAIEALLQSLSLTGERPAAPWHYLALAYAYYKLHRGGDDRGLSEYNRYLSLAKSHRWYAESRDFYKRLYPEIASDL